MMEWISIKDRLPDIYDFALVFANNQGINEPKPVSIARLLPDLLTWQFMAQEEDEDGSAFGVYQDIEWEIDSKDITHWMPLPKFPVSQYEKLKYAVKYPELAPKTATMKRYKKEQQQPIEL
jgi:hypothetical protein